MKFKTSYIISGILSLLYTIRIFKMYFSTHPHPPFYQLPAMLIFGYVFIFVISSIVISNRNKKGTKNSSKLIDMPSSTAPQPSVAYRRFFKVAGVTYECGLNNAYSRSSIIRRCKTSDKLYLKEFTYASTPAYYIVLEKNDLDIGCVPAFLVDTIEKYKGCRYEIAFVDIHYFTPKDKPGRLPSVEVQFTVYKD